MAEMTERVETLEQLMSDLLRAQQRTETSLDAYIRESREGRRVLREEMRQFKEEAQADRKAMREEMLAYREEGRLQRERMDRESREFRERMDRESREFKDEMREFKDEMREFKNEMREFKEESQADRKALHEEMRQFKDEMREFTEESQRARRELDRKWGDLANKMGTVVEDIILPGFPGAVRRTFGVELDTLAVRVSRKHPHDRGREREFDIVATDASRFFLNETKSNPRMQYAKEFVESLDEVLEYFPEFGDRTLVPILSSLSLPTPVIDYLSAHRCYAMMMGEEHMEIVNG